VDKLYVIVRADLDPGLQIAQSCHAMRQFVACHPEVEMSWFTGSNNIAILQVPGEAELRALADRAEACGIEHAVFQEPDLDNAETAMALAPRGRRLVGQLPRALRPQLQAA
jgi:peptidyl-tRNA hydrolase